MYKQINFIILHFLLLLSKKIQFTVRVMSPVFHFMLFTSWTCGNFTELSYNIAEGIVFVQCSLHLCWWLSSTCKTRACIPSCYKLLSFLCSHMCMVFFSALSLA